MKSLLSAIIVLGIAVSVALFSYQPKVSLPTVQHDPRPAEILALMKAHDFAPDQYQYVSQIVKDATQNSIPASLLVCIELEESSGGKRFNHATFNPFGWNSDKTGFTSERAAIDYISAQLGNGPYYAGKSIQSKLNAYNPNPAYALRVMACMKEIDE